MISDTFELYYYSTIDVPGVKEHTHTHYEFYLFLEGAISLEIDGVLYTPMPGVLLLIPPGVPHHLVIRSEVNIDESIVSENVSDRRSSW